MKKYNTFIFENYIEMTKVFNDADILESIVTNSDELLNSIKAEEKNLFQELNINPDKLESLNKLTIDELFDNKYFNDTLSKKYRKGLLETSVDLETFLDNTIIIKYFLIWDKNVSELERPKYIVFQSKKRKDENWENIKLYTVNDDLSKFDTKLTSKRIVLSKNDKEYTYFTTTSGNEWELEAQDENDKFKKIMNNDDIKAILIDDDVSITILA